MRRRKACCSPPPPLAIQPSLFQDLTKIEFSVLPSCVGSVVYSIDDVGSQRPAQYQLKPYPTVKINGLGKRFIDVPGACQGGLATARQEKVARPALTPAPLRQLTP
jgi:hypothetical protein